MKSKNSMAAAAIFAAMKAVVEQEGYPLLKHYRDDFYKIDRGTILNEFTAGSVYLWVVNVSGTHLNRIGVDQKENDWAVAAISDGLTTTRDGIEIYRISDAGVEEITPDQARAEMRKWYYKVDNNVVSTAAGKLLAVVDVRRHFKTGDGNTYATVQFQSPCLEQLSKGDLLALRDIGRGQAVRATSSLFVKIDALTINGQDIGDLLAARVEKEVADVADCCV